MCLLAWRGSKPTGEVTRDQGQGQSSDASSKRAQTASPSRGPTIERPAPFPRDGPRVRSWQRSRQRKGKMGDRHPPIGPRLVTRSFIYNNMWSSRAGTYLPRRLRGWSREPRNQGQDPRRLAGHSPRTTKLQGKSINLSGEKKLHFRVIFKKIKISAKKNLQ